MNLSDLFGLWAIRPEARDALLLSFERFLEAATPEQVASAIARGTLATGTKPLPYSIQDGVAVLKIQGTLSKNPMFDWWGDPMGVAYDNIVAGVENAQKDPNVRCIIQAWDSPGGTVDGAQEAANDLFAMRSAGKPMESVACGQMCSAGEMVGSASGPVWASSDTTDMGSIGVLAVHRDYSGAMEKWGVKTTLLTAGKYKGVGWGPLSAEDKQILQEGLDHSYQIFKQTVARNRGISMDAVEAMAEGRVFKGQKAVQVGLASGVATVGSRVAALAKQYGPSMHRVAFAIAEPNHNPKQERRMDKETLLKEQPELAEAFRAEGRAEGMETGAKNERARIDGVLKLEAKVTGCNDKIRELALDGKTTPEQATMQIMDLVAEKKATIVAAVREGAAKPVAAAPSQNGGVEAPKLSGSEFADRIAAVMAEQASKGNIITPVQAKALVMKNQEGA